MKRGRPRKNGDPERPYGTLSDIGMTKRQSSDWQMFSSGGGRCWGVIVSRECSTYFFAAADGPHGHALIRASSAKLVNRSFHREGRRSK
jgi:hypothetical protein